MLAILLGACERPADYFPGYAEADYVRLASPITGALTRLYVQRGQALALGAPVFVLEQDNERAARAAAERRVQRARAVLADLEKGRRPDEIAAVRAQQGQAQAALDLARVDLKRIEPLVGPGSMAQDQLDRARAAVLQNEERVRELQAQVRVAQLPSRPDQLEAARQDVRTAEAELAQAEWALRQKSLKSPVDATVDDLFFREGELVQSGAPVVRLLAPQYVRARFFVPEARLGTLKLGQRVSVSCDGCGAPLPATISFISRTAEYTTPLIYSRETRATLVFMIEATPSADGARKLHPGQPIEVRFAQER